MNPFRTGLADLPPALQEPARLGRIDGLRASREQLQRTRAAILQSLQDYDAQIEAISEEIDALENGQLSLPV
jgi:hypothetical protein